MAVQQQQQQENIIVIVLQGRRGECPWSGGASCLLVARHDLHHLHHLGTHFYFLVFLQVCTSMTPHRPKLPAQGRRGITRERRLDHYRTGKCDLGEDRGKVVRAPGQRERGGTPHNHLGTISSPWNTF
ncbi:hypothetical protein E2C01_066856 [Portunus trituberculatus]|uniref:Uncharacterized protein n=1 Tax=Portunus trituberculatus TaxID=210409 RepID=A0A5B7HVU2_PORTR|nr:hypothetical protein [Portunus trituberculatus]